MGGLGARDAARRGRARRLTDLVGSAPRLAVVRVTLNGGAREVPDGCSVEELIQAVELDPAFVIVEHNGEPLERKRYGDVVVSAGDRVELVRAVAGG